MNVGYHMTQYFVLKLTWAVITRMIDKNPIDMISVQMMELDFLLA